MAPEYITQKGIQNVIECDLGFLSRILNRNIEEGNLYRVKSKVNHKKRKQNVFFLTEKGIRLAKDIDKCVNNKD